MKPIAPGLVALDDADQIRGRILMAFEEAERQSLSGDASTNHQELLTFVLVGGGTVGVEMAGTIAEMSRMALAHDFRHLRPGAVQVLLYEGHRGYCRALWRSFQQKQRAIWNNSG